MEVVVAAVRSPLGAPLGAALGLVMVLLVPLDGVGPEPAAADAVAPIDAALPTGRMGAALAWTGHRGFVFGGWDGAASAEILAFDPAANGVTRAAARFPTPLLYPTAVWDGRATEDCPQGCAYVVGGWKGSGPFSAAIHRYDPTRDGDAGRNHGLTTMSAVLPSGRWAASSVFADGAVYVFGGQNGASVFADVVRYDPVLDAVAVVASLPAPQAGSAAALRLDEDCPAGCAYVFGAHRLSDGTVSGVVRYDVAARSVTASRAGLEPRTLGAALWDGTATEDCPVGCAYVLGGRLANGTLLDETVRYDPAGDRFEQVGERLPTRLCCAAAFWAGTDAPPPDPGACPSGCAYLVGGWNGTARNVILRLDAAVPMGLTAAIDPFDSEGHTIVASWDAPLHREAVGRYVVERRGPDEEVSQIATDASSYVDSDVESGATYRYRVRSVLADGRTSLPGNEVAQDALRIPGRPENLRAHLSSVLPVPQDHVAAFADRVPLRWRGAGDGVPVVGFDLLRRCASTSLVTHFVLGAVASYDDTPPTGHWIYSVKARNGAGTSTPSAEYAAVVVGPNSGEPACSTGAGPLLEAASADRNDRQDSVKSYDQLAADVLAICHGVRDQPKFYPGYFGGGCFPNPCLGQASSCAVEIAIADVLDGPTGYRVGAYAEFLRGGEPDELVTLTQPVVVGSEILCGSTKVDGEDYRDADHVMVWIGGPLLGPATCLLSDESLGHGGAKGSICVRVAGRCGGLTP